MAAKDDLGRLGEQVAVDYLTARDHVVVDRNWRCADGELDIVTLIDRLVVVVEVKTRRTMAYGDPLRAVDAQKLARLWRLAHRWRAAHADLCAGRGVRVDIVGVTGHAESGFAVAHLEDVR